MDKHRKDYEFNPHEIEEQIRELGREQRVTSPETHLVHTLYEVNTADERIIQRTRTRLIETLNTRPDLIERHTTRSNPGDDVRRITPIGQRKRGNTMQRGFLVFAAILVAILIIVGGFFGVQLLRPPTAAPPVEPGKTPVATTPTPRPDTTPPLFLYIVKDDGVFKINSSDHSDVWGYPIDRENWEIHQSYISQADKTIFISLRNVKTDQAVTRALDMENGKVRWEQEWLAASLIVDDGTVYVSTYMPGTSGEVINSVRALEATTGKVTWSISEEGWSVRSVSDDKLILTRRFIEQPASLSVRDKTNGKQIWILDFDPAENFTSTPLIVDDALYITSCTYALVPENSTCYQHVYGADSGREVWILPLPDRGFITTSEEVIADGVIYLGMRTANENKLIALSISKQDVLWSVALAEMSGNITSMVISDNVIYIGTVSPNVGQGYATAIDASNFGKTLWSVQINDYVAVGPVIKDGPLSGVYYHLGGGSGKSRVELRKLTDGSVIKVYTVGDEQMAMIREIAVGP